MWQRSKNVCTHLYENSLRCPFRIISLFNIYAPVTVNPMDPQVNPRNSDRENVYLSEYPHYRERSLSESPLKSAFYIFTICNVRMSERCPTETIVVVRISCIIKVPHVRILRVTWERIPPGFISTCALFLILLC